MKVKSLIKTTKKLIITAGVHVATDYAEYAFYTPQISLFISANQAQSTIPQYTWNNKMQTFKSLLNAGKYNLRDSLLDYIRINKLNILKEAVFFLRQLPPCPRPLLF